MGVIGQGTIDKLTPHIEEILERIIAGDSQREIAEDLGISASQLTYFLQSNKDLEERSAHARSMSAEGWLDRGLAGLKDAPSTSEEVARARYIAQECARRAALRNPQYRDKQDHNHTGNITINATPTDLEI